MAIEGYPQWQFDWEAAEKAAFEKLRPYYEKILDFAKGDVDLAKRIIEFDYSQGMREAKEQYEAERRAQALTFPEEREQMWTGLGRRGIARSGIAGTEAGKLQERQSIRREAIDRALREKEVRLTERKKFGVEEAEAGLAKETQTLGREHQREATEVTGVQMGVAGQVYGAKVGEWSAEEQRRIAEEQRKAMGSLSGGGGSGIKKTDINPATGKQYAVNPATGNWDDTYWATVVEPQLKSMGYNR